ncbi:MAG: hypothetical protein Terrestrivirus10_16 [Terrestrivirus sp.]|uniref:Uncharacterized protein n=1 Tax=Terrestrivirus sp. TaxID=2487775 RepID=A0A3G4ZP05_9VIRU|nr:MAG: hypothetical protein Terrestrivirus10_16 [Terrestrivirus sp.]
MASLTALYNGDSVRTAVRYAVGVYSVAVAGGFVIGSWKGFTKWSSWLETRTYRKIAYENVETVVNIAADTGKLGYNVLVAGTTSALVVATSPVSVPLILWKIEDKPEKK